jgi:hypothetical protein
MILLVRNSRFKVTDEAAALLALQNAAALGKIECNAWELHNTTGLREGLLACGWCTTTTGIAIIYFYETVLEPMRVIAPFVVDGSYVELLLDTGIVTYRFTDGKFEEKP